jgi:hypothetical protein
MRAGIEQAFVVGDLMARTARQLVILTLPFICWLATQENPTQMLFAWGFERGTAMLAARKASARGNQHSPDFRVSFHKPLD